MLQKYRKYLYFPNFFIARFKFSQEFCFGDSEILIIFAKRTDTQSLMGQLAFLRMYILVSIPSDINDNRRHVHVFKRGGRHLKSMAKIWIEKNGEKNIEVAESVLTVKDLNMISEAIDRHWDFINDQITKSFNGEKTQIKNIED